MSNDALAKIKAAAEDLNRRGGGLRVEELPLEVRRGIGWWRSTQLDRVFCVMKGTSGRSAAWRACRAYGETIGVKEEPDYTGWRSNHTTHYWVWWAQDLGDLRALADVAQWPEEDLNLALTTRTVDEFIDRMWEEFKP
jgi:hypothetical protein